MVAVYATFGIHQTSGVDDLVDVIEGCFRQATLTGFREHDLI